ncbi:hypothetical protein G6O69_19190 [Pseudenhygromyxa sp. WMMC2535]|uniref:hypothetical protein n=1 Tax=Pseudenhygromyxa sp. WMMC2535 TaxID=2712867 RepID=UPI001551F223|nr:hypothetical protein [Pseudenhygromyxa sp. WMMC2535]NVB39978.1 hypothetical protein [Pseudenhygromyxa sp. WMMC2535]
MRGASLLISFWLGSSIACGGRELGDAEGGAKPASAAARGDDDAVQTERPGEAEPRDAVEQPDEVEQSGAREQVVEAMASPEGPPISGELGDASSQACRSAMARLAELEGLRRKSEARGTRVSGEAVFALWTKADRHGESLREWVAAADLRLGRVPTRGDGRDVVLIGQALEQLRTNEDDGVAARALVDVITQLREVAFLDHRRLLAEVSESQERGDGLGARLGGQWDEAWCLWSGAVAPLAEHLDAADEDAVDEGAGWEGWSALVTDAFASGRAGIHDDGQDPAKTRPARRIIDAAGEAVVLRRVLELAALGAEQPAGPLEAAMLLDLLSAPMSGTKRSGRTLAEMQRMLYGDPAQVEVARIERGLAQTFAVLARAGCDEAVDRGTLGDPAGIASAWEGLIYARALLPGMRAALGEAGFDAAAYLDSWATYRRAVEDGDSTRAAAVAEALVRWNCAYREALGEVSCAADPG